MKDVAIHIDEAVTVFKQGGIVIFPTDTAFGIGCRVDNPEAIEKLYSIRKRPLTQAAPVLVAGKKMAEEYVLSIPPDVDEKLLREYWPGALTVILPCRVDKVDTLARGGGLTVGLRMPNHPTTLQIIENLGVPILGPSANFHGDPTPYDLASVDPNLYHLVDYIVPGVCSVKRESTVIDCSVQPWQIVRQGAVRLNYEL